MNAAQRSSSGREFTQHNIANISFARAAVLLCLLVDLSIAAQAATINFDEFPADNDNGAMPANRYASLGITFMATDDGLTWGGLAAGDPGTWGIAGTGGSTFSGFNGDSYGLRTTFNSPVSSFSLDVSRSNGSSPADTFTLEGWRAGVLVESHTVTLATINQWQTLSLSQVVDETRWSGAGVGFHPFGIDNLNWSVVPEPSSACLIILGAGTLLLRNRAGVKQARS
jgi:hypothetical protein